VEWNEARPDYDPEGFVHRLFATVAERWPDRVALVADGETVSYGELARQVGELARHLGARGVGPETVVGILLDRSPRAVVALLAVLAAGGAFLPLDPEAPRARLACILADGLGGEGPHLVLTVGEHAERLPTELPAGGVEVVLLGGDGQGPGSLAALPAAPESGVTLGGVTPGGVTPGGVTPGDAGGPAIAPEHPAYVIYTSGSTGKPKGVIISHRALANRILWIQAAELRASHSFLHKTTLTFDVALAELFGPLILGARVILARPGGQRDPSYLAAIVAREGITHASFPPALLALLLERPGSDRELASLRVLVTGGETVPPELSARVGDRLPGATLFNRYGPTEATISVLTGACDPRSREARLPLGRPIARARVYVLGPDLEPLCPGQVGEIVIGGICLARGYLGRPGRSAECFVPDPFGGGVGERLYRSGDRARQRPDGAFEFLGRIDDQVKIRGFRVEPGDVEAALAEHPEVREVAVVSRAEEHAFSHRLVAFVVPRNGTGGGEREAREALSEATLRAFAARRLPAYMVPSAWVLQGDLPRTASGKVDRPTLSRLPLPEVKGRAGTSPPPGRTAGGDDLELRLSALFREVLGVADIEPEASLFELGGHSLSLARLEGHLNAELGVKVGVEELARCPSVVGVAELIRSGGVSRGKSPEELAREASLPPEVTVVRSGPIPAGPVAAVRGSGDPPAVLLTGATGFLGAHILDELLRRTGSRVLCLVRRQDPAAARASVFRALDGYRLGGGIDPERVEVVLGDLSRPGLALAPDSRRHLAEQVGAIYHCGAQVHLGYPYEALKATNVEGTREILRLACQGMPKPVHYISTLSVLEDDPHRNGTAAAEEPLGGLPIGLAGGYRQSKWVAERLVELARGRGLPAVIYRPGWVTGAGSTGLANLQDFLTRLLLASLNVGLAPELASPEGDPPEVRPTPVDFVSSAVVWLSRQPESVGGIFHLINTCSISLTTVLALLAARGLPLRRVSRRRWATALLTRSCQNGTDSSLLAPLAPFLRQVAATPEEAPPWRPRRFATERTEAALARGPIVCPCPDERLLATCLEAFRQQGLLVPPGARESAFGDLGDVLGEV